MNVTRFPIAIERPDVVYPHEARHAMLAAGLASFPEIQEDPTGAVHTMTGLERGSDQSEQSFVLSSSIGNWVLSPLVEGAARDTESLTHHPYVKLVAVCFNKRT
jgi:hypothetical protein